MLLLGWCCRKLWCNRHSACLSIVYKKQWCCLCSSFSVCGSLSQEEDQFPFSGESAERWQTFIFRITVLMLISVSVLPEDPHRLAQVNRCLCLCRSKISLLEPVCRFSLDHVHLSDHTQAAAAPCWDIHHWVVLSDGCLSCSHGGSPQAIWEENKCVEVIVTLFYMGLRVACEESEAFCIPLRARDLSWQSARINIYTNIFVFLSALLFNGIFYMNWLKWSVKAKTTGKLKLVNKGTRWMKVWCVLGVFMLWLLQASQLWACL